MSWDLTKRSIPSELYVIKWTVLTPLSFLCWSVQTFVLQIRCSKEKDYTKNVTVYLNPVSNYIPNIQLI